MNTNLLLFISLHYYFTLFVVFIVGAILGSFLNVIIYRYPLMLEAAWREECETLLDRKFSHPKKKFNLCWPRSHCPSCQNTIPYWCNIPLISFILLQAHCIHCRAKISLRYFLVELISAIATVIIFTHFSVSLLGLEVLVLTYGLIVLSFIDLKHRILPDTITLSLLWLGLLVSLQHIFVPPEEAIVGVIVGYLFLYIILQLYRLCRKKEGMGLGDCKMLAMFGAWLGWMPLPQLLLIASLTALVVAGISLLLKKTTKDHLIPFGPFLAVSGWVLIVYGNQWMAVWLQTHLLSP